eukprot:jgi/Picre1/34711/NNA_002179.t1
MVISSLVDAIVDLSEIQSQHAPKKVAFPPCKVLDVAGNEDVCVASTVKACVMEETGAAMDIVDVSSPVEEQTAITPSIQAMILPLAMVEGAKRISAMLWLHKMACLLLVVHSVCHEDSMMPVVVNVLASTLFSLLA